MKALLAVIIIVAINFLIWFFLPSSDPELGSNVPTIMAPIEKPLEPASFPANSAAATPAILDKKTIDPELALSNWKESHGYDEDYATSKAYSSYDFDTLIALAHQGDLVALQMVSGPLIIFRKEYDQGRDFMLEAAARGSTQALINLGHYHRDNQLPPTDGDPILDALPYYIVAGFRGEPTANSMVNMVTGHSNNFLEIGRSFPSRDLSEKELSTVCDNARSIFRAIESQRRELGFTEFDNSFPPGMEDKAATTICQ